MNDEQSQPYDREAFLLARVAELEALIWNLYRDWTNVPEWAKWWAVDEDGYAHIFEKKPRRGAHGWITSAVTSHTWSAGDAEALLSVMGIAWEDTLTARPTQQEAA